MTSRHPFRIVNTLVLALVLTLAAVPVHALPLEEPTLSWSVNSFWEALRGLLSSLWAEEGMSIDPNGPTGVTGDGDEGITIDPDGLTGEEEEGMLIDPNG